MNDKSPEILIQRINELIEKKCLKKKDVAEKLGMEYLTFWRKLKGKRGVDAVLLTKIANILGTSVSYLMGETDNPNRDNGENSSSKAKKPKEQTGILSFAYWRNVFDAAQDIADSGDRDAIAYVSQILNRALSLLAAKSDECTLPSLLSDISAVTNSQVILGNNNKNNLTVAK